MCHTPLGMAGKILGVMPDQTMANQTPALDPFTVICKKYVYLPTLQVTPIILNANCIQWNGRWLAFPPEGKEAELPDTYCTFSPAIDLPVPDFTRPSILLLSDTARTPSLTPKILIKLTPTTMAHSAPCIR